MRRRSPATMRQAERDARRAGERPAESERRSSPHFPFTLPARFLLDKLRQACREGKRMASGLTRNQVPGNRLRVRIPCPPLWHVAKPVAWQRVSFFAPSGSTPSRILSASVMSRHEKSIAGISQSISQIVA